MKTLLPTTAPALLFGIVPVHTAVATVNLGELPTFHAAFDREYC